MCLHRRTVYTDCNHGVWGGIVVPCKRERAFYTSEAADGCDRMESHGLHTFRVSGLCLECTASKEKMDGQFARLRDCLRSLRLNVDHRVQGQQYESTKVDGESDPEVAADEQKTGCDITSQGQETEGRGENTAAGGKATREICVTNEARRSV